MLVFHSADYHITCLKKLIKETNDRTEKALNSLSQLIFERNPKVIVIAGDIFNTPQPNKDEIHLFMKFLLPILKEEITVIVIPGNHEIDRDNGKTALNFLMPFDETIENFHIAINDFKCVEIDDVVFLLWPWGMLPHKKHLKKLKQFKHHKRIGVSHITMINTVISKDNRILRKGYSTNSLREAIDLFELDFMLLGDIHEYQIIEDKAIYSGALYQTKFNESPKKGVACIDTSKQKCNFIEVTNVPKLLNITVDDDLDTIRDDGNFYTLQIESKEEFFVIPKDTLPSNIVRISYPFGKVDLDNKQTSKRIGFSVSIPKVLSKVLEKQGVKDVKGALGYLKGIVKSNNDLILP